ncbi:MAG: hypothetical protein GQ531_02395 [Sulfurovum sp.]|nr:hypothetical protein [Sulfurovum sp.]
MQDNRFSHLFSKKNSEKATTLTKGSKKLILLFFTLFFFFYLEYKPYHTQAHAVSSLSETIFTLYQFIINQTLGIVHEGGHGVCYILPCPKFMGVFNGTLFQWLFPLGIALYYKRKHNMMAFYAGLFILSISLDYSAWYMSTAQQGAYVPAAKSFLGVDGLHDFHYIFTTLGVLSYASFIAGFTKAISMILMFGALLAMFFEAF